MQQRNIWLDLLSLPNSANGRVCSKHFNPEDLEKKGNGHVWLKRNACPNQVDFPDVFVEVEIDEDVSVYGVSFVSLNVNQKVCYCQVRKAYIRPSTCSMFHDNKLMTRQIF